MGIKNFFRKIGQGLKKAGRWIKDKVFPVVGRIAKPVLNIIGALPGKIGMIGKIGGIATDILHNAASQIPNENAKQKINNFIATGNEKFQGVIDKGKGFAERVNGGIDQARQSFETIKNDPNWQKLHQNIKLLPVDAASKIDVNRWKKNNM